VAVASEPCPTDPLSSAAAARIAVVVAAREHFLLGAPKPPDRTWDPNAEDSLVWAYYDLIEDQSAVSDEALAALVGFYNGESAELECEVLERGARMLPYLERFERCPPSVALPASPVHSRSAMFSQIVDGASCER
jgi:hypothetical protein